MQSLSILIQWNVSPYIDAYESPLVAYLYKTLLVNEQKALGSVCGAVLRLQGPQPDIRVQLQLPLPIILNIIYFCDIPMLKALRMLRTIQKQWLKLIKKQ